MRVLPFYAAIVIGLALLLPIVFQAFRVSEASQIPITQALASALRQHCVMATAGAVLVVLASSSLMAVQLVAWSQGRREKASSDE